VEQHNLDSRKTLADSLAQLLGVEVGQAAIEKQHLPEAALQVDHGFRPSAGLLEAAGRGTQTFENTLAHRWTGASHQDAVSIVGRHRVTGHSPIRNESG